MTGTFLVTNEFAYKESHPATGDGTVLAGTFVVQARSEDDAEKAVLTLLIGNRNGPGAAAPFGWSVREI